MNIKRKLKHNSSSVGKGFVEINYGMVEKVQLAADDCVPSLEMNPPRIFDEMTGKKELGKENGKILKVRSCSRKMPSENGQKKHWIKDVTELPKEGSPRRMNNLLLDGTQTYQQPWKQRKLVLDEGSCSLNKSEPVSNLVSPPESHDHSGPLNISHMQPSLDPPACLSAEPHNDPIWRGHFNIAYEEGVMCIRIWAHLSNKASPKVSIAATALPPILDVDTLKKYVVWPKQFNELPPTDASVGLYFFPENERDEKFFDNLLEHLIERDLSLKVVINDVELLIFSSLELPPKNWRFRGKYFLWGVFRVQRLHSCLTESAYDPISSRSAVNGASRSINSGHSRSSNSGNEARNRLVDSSSYPYL